MHLFLANNLWCSSRAGAGALCCSAWVTALTQPRNSWRCFFCVQATWKVSTPRCWHNWFFKVAVWCSFSKWEEKRWRWKGSRQGGGWAGLVGRAHCRYGVLWSSPSLATNCTAMHCSHLFGFLLHAGFLLQNPCQAAGFLPDVEPSWCE